MGRSKRVKSGAPRKRRTVEHVLDAREDSAAAPPESSVVRRNPEAHAAVDWAALVETAPDAVLVSDAAGRYIVVNDAGCRLLGRKREEILGATVFDLLGAAEMERMKGLPTDLQLDGVQRFEWLFRRSDGDEIPIEVHTRLLPNGQRQSILRDARAQKQREQEQQQDFVAMQHLLRINDLLIGAVSTENFLEGIVDAAVAIAEADFGTIQMYDSGAQRLRVVTQRGLPRGWVDYWDQQTSGGSSAEAVRLRERVIVLDLEEAATLVGAAELDVQRHAGIRSEQSTPLIGRSGTLLGVCSTHYRAAGGPPPRAVHFLDLLARQAADIIEHIQANAQLAQLRALEQRALQARDEVLSVVAHDLGSPLNAILLQTQLMHRHSEPERRDVSVLARIAAEGQRMNRLLTDLLDVASLDTGSLRQARTPIAPQTIVAAATERLKVWASFNGHELLPELEPDLPAIFADPDRMAQVLDNLIANAVKFSPTGNRITLGARSSEDAVVFRVHNCGPAIPPAALPHLFDRLWQHERHERRGVGLGLFIVKRVVELHGGRVWVDSSQAAGTTFHFSIPTR